MWYYGKSIDVYCQAATYSVHAAQSLDSSDQHNNIGRSDWMDSGIDCLNLDQCFKALKILDVMGQQAGDIISQHGGHNICIMNLFASDLENGK